MNWYLKALQNYANFSGRARRKEYWMFFLFNILISYGLLILSAVTETPALVMVYVLYSLGVLIPGIAVGVRRMHDVGKSGWYIIVPIYNLVLACTEGEHTDNQYGPDPKGEKESAMQKV
ncbi:DUF805 domain-containing protein [Pseudozobellia thermophila]|uniref:Uncharacterized membrane protein YhaH, DUF805 family n=1 Tax=Pseudozobellia thermophila TaxID=192903 RepID=A0A1M6J174_9FLAO|nr:DUF805 domain-containing protein [Pseudozobellia thermophila]SHJ40389.1 Uncharacterized membrane protein YhaH, DUF805 family [Pseudozobellia thermophila]